MNSRFYLGPKGKCRLSFLQIIHEYEGLTSITKEDKTIVPFKLPPEENEEKCTTLTINTKSSSLSSDSITNSLALLSPANFSYLKELKESFKS